ncbi:MAG: peptide ABC transporter substrate-binding protein [Chlamydiales bacterium]
MIQTFLRIALLLVCSCNNSSIEKTKKQSVRLNIHSEPPTLDPRKATDSTSVSVIKMCFDGLVRQGRDGKIVPALASEIEISPEGDVYTFHLRDALWSDGTPVTAQDFEESWKGALDPRFPSERAYDLYPLKNAQRAKEGALPLSEIGVKSIDKKTLQVKLEYPTSHFLKILISHSFLPTPRHVQAKAPTWADSDKHYVSTGPFKLKKWSHYNEIVLEKNPLYWDAEVVKLEEVYLAIIENENTELALFDKGDLDWAGSPLSQLPLDPLPSLLHNKGAHEYPFSGVYYYVFNTKEFPFHNTNLRRAFALALDRQSIIDNITQGNQLPAMSLIPPTMWKRNVSHFRDGAVEEARVLFEQALLELGLTKETFPEITLSYNTVASHHKIAQAVQQQWKEALGVRVRLENKEWKVFLNELVHHQFQIARLGGVASVNDPADFLENYRYDASNRNYPQWSHEKFSALLAKAERCKADEKRMDYLAEAEKILIEEMPVIPLYFYTGHYLKKPYIKEVYISETNEIDLKHAYIDQ